MLKINREPQALKREIIGGFGGTHSTPLVVLGSLRANYKPKPYPTEIIFLPKFEYPTSRKGGETWGTRLSATSDSAPILFL
jgi:hypothetical protein